VKAVIEVADTGEGIAREHQARIFERFYRADKTRSRAEGGAGLGLAMAKLAVERHGGRIELESAQARGATFRVLLPLSCLTSWAAFLAGKQADAMVMGDFVLFEDEVNPVISAAFDNGLEVTALHNHFFHAEPQVYFIQALV